MVLVAAGGFALSPGSGLSWPARMGTTYKYTGAADATLPLKQVIPPKAAVIAARRLQRLDSMRAAMTAGTPLPPIEVYLFGGRTFLVGGLHRYTVTRELGYPDITVVYRSDRDLPIRPFTLADYE